MGCQSRVDTPVYLDNVVVPGFAVSRPTDLIANALSSGSSFGGEAVLQPQCDHLSRMLRRGSETDMPFQISFGHIQALVVSTLEYHNGIRGK